MSLPEEHIYLGLSDPLPLLSKNPENVHTKNVMNLTETELRLGLPGSDSQTRKPAFGVSLFGKDLKDDIINGSSSSSKNLVSGAKRGFADAINGSVKWGLGIHAGSEGNLVKTDASATNTTLPAEEIHLKPLVVVEKNKNENANNAPASKAQVVGWPPIRSFRKNTLTTNSEKSGPEGCLYVKVSMDGAPYLRKIDLKTYSGYTQLSSALEKMFSCFTIGQCGQGQESLTESRLMDLLHGSEYVLTYEDKDGDWMLVGDVPWGMFMDSCKRLRIMKGSDAIGLAPRTMQKCQSQN